MKFKPIHAVLAMGLNLAAVGAIIVRFIVNTFGPPLDFWAPLLWSAALFVPVLIFLMIVWRLLLPAPAVFSFVFLASALFFSVFASNAAILTVNTALDFSDDTIHRAKVVEVLQKRSGRAHHYLVVRVNTWRPGHRTEEIALAKVQRERIQPGDSLELRVRPGALRMPRISSVRVVKSDGTTMPVLLEGRKWK